MSFQPLQTATGRPGENANFTRYQTLQWNLFGISIPFAIIALYLSVVQTIYFVRKKLKQRDEMRRENTIEENLMTILCIIPSVTSIISGIDLRIMYGYHDDFSCTMSTKYGIVAFTSALISIYLVYWLRQRIIYKNPALGHLTTPCTKCFSWFMGIMAVSLVLSFYIYFLATTNVVASSDGCVIPSQLPDSLSYMINISGWSTYTVGYIVLKICLTGFFIYPLIKHNRRMEEILPESGRDNSLNSLIKRVAISAGISVGTDIVIGTVEFSLIILNVNIALLIPAKEFASRIYIIANVLCLLLSFPDWRKRLIPWKMNLKQQDSSKYTKP